MPSSESQTAAKVPATAPLRSWLGRAALFCAVALVLATGLDHLLKSGLRRIAVSDFGVWNAILAGQVHSDVLVIGASRALVQVDTELLEKTLGLRCFNLGLDGSRSDLQRGLLQTFLKYNPAPKVAIISLDISIMERTQEAFKRYQYTPYLHEETIYAMLAAFDGDVWKRRYLPLYGFAGDPPLLSTAIKGLLGKEDPQWPIRRHGYEPVERAWDGSFAAFAKENPQGLNFPMEDGAFAALGEMATALEARGTRVLWLFTPEMVDIVPLQRNREAILQRLHAVANQHGGIFLDYSGLPMCRERRWFYNSQHLNRAGAEAFTALLAQDLQPLVAFAKAAGAAPTR